MREDEQPTVNTRRMVALAIFVVFCFVVLSFLYQLQVKYSQAQCYSRVNVLRGYNQTWDDLAALERQNESDPAALRDARIKIYERAQIPLITC